MGSVLRVQAVKAARREEDVAVCVVQLIPSESAPESDSQYLLVQRPEKGLLAGINAPVLLTCLHLLKQCMQIKKRGQYMYCEVHNVPREP